MVCACASADGGGATVKASRATIRSAGTRRARIMSEASWARVPAKVARGPDGARGPRSLTASRGAPRLRRGVPSAGVWRPSRGPQLQLGPARVHEPLAALAAAGGAERGLGALDVEARPEAPAHLGAGDREGRAGAHGPQREEAPQEPAPRTDDRRHRAQVLVAAGRVDGAEARVLPHAVEGVGGLLPERED